MIALVGADAVTGYLRVFKTIALDSDVAWTLTHGGKNRDNAAAAIFRQRTGTYRSPATEPIGVSRRGFVQPIRPRIRSIHA